MGNTWSKMFYEEFAKAVKEEPYASQISEVVYTFSDGDVTKQINNIEDLITQKVDAIIVTPNSTTALIPILTEAREAGIVVVLNAVYNEDESGDSYDASAYYDNIPIAEMRARWLFDKLGGNGKVLEVTGIPGVSANEDSVSTHAKVADEYPGIEIIGSVQGNWAYADTKTGIANALASYPQIDGILCQNGEQCLAIIDAYEEAGKPLVPMMGDDYNGLLKKMVECYDKRDAGDPMYANFDVVFHSMPVYLSVDALDLALKCLKGEECDFTDSFRYPKTYIEESIGLVGEEGYKDYVKPDLPDGVCVVTNLTDKELLEMVGRYQL